MADDRPSPSASTAPSSVPIPGSPATSSPPVSAGPRPIITQPKKANPLVDLIETEKNYVELLTGIIRKVASAWSRQNFPPPALDAMFRAIEAVYKANRGLLSKLNDIGPNPTSPKALGDLLMKWIDDLDTPYTRYCSAYAVGFDYWDPVSTNTRLPDVLSELSAANPPRVPPPSSPDPGGTFNPDSAPDAGEWTLDKLFALPWARLRYYKKLYTRLLKSTTPGRSDHRLLTRANERLETLLAQVEERSSLRAEDVNAEAAERKARDRSAARGSREGSQAPSVQPPSYPNREQREEEAGRPNSDATRSSVRSSGAGTASSTSDRHSRDTAGTSVGNFPSSSSLSSAVTDLEKRLATDRTLDIFTMQPKAVRLQMNPPGLSFSRALRTATDVQIIFTPRSTGQEVVQPSGHVFVLTDLFLVCERIAPEERPGGEGGPDMWLSYPPLAGKHLKVVELPGDENAFQIVVMKKETLTLVSENRITRDQLMQHFIDCIDFAASSASWRLAPPVSESRRVDLGFAVAPKPAPPPPQQNGLPPAPDAPWTGSGEFGSRGPSPFPPGQQPPFMGGPLERDVYPDAPGFEFGGPPHRGTPPPNGSFVPPPRGASRGFAPNGLPPGPGFGGPMPPAPLNLGPGGMGGQMSPYGPSPGPSPVDPARMYKSPSARSVSQPPPDDRRGMPPPGPQGYPNNYPPPPPVPPQYGGFSNGGFPPQMGQGPPPGAGWQPPPRARSLTGGSSSYHDVSPPMSPEARPSGPITSTLSAQMKCKVFLQQNHAQWKSLGSARLKLYLQQPVNQKQLVVEADSKDKQIIISTIVLTDGVERVGKTGVAIELSDQGQRTGTVYMIQLRNETSASGLFDSLLAGSDRARG
ncbi:hypothetical protein EXIGLDRAFT_710990 [Exidia glandulosa HHB12029]|uniref:DH domain-containing protein n=1 Tax=Exidia glandulosa HHB12029 TaxID=1314781 RepID=A0A165NFK6_EXIGL|nr:hypothetical protein EXIGLDRAFT_710990 [Exidia glandulosa HHB12029]